MTPTAGQGKTSQDGSGGFRPALPAAFIMHINPLAKSFVTDGPAKHSQSERARAHDVATADPSLTPANALFARMNDGSGV